MVRENADILNKNNFKNWRFKVICKIGSPKIKTSPWCSTSTFLKFKLIDSNPPQSVPVVRWNKERGPATLYCPLRKLKSVNIYCFWNRR